MGPLAWTATGLAGVLTLVLARLRWRNWGATAAEQAEVFPGDELIPDPAGVTTLSVTVNAPADEVWRWLVQIGQDRGGMYSYDWLENSVGLDIHSASDIHSDWQRLEVGDRVVLIKPGWMGLKSGFSLPVESVEPGRAIVLRQAPPEHPWDAVWSFHVIPVGDARCRLVSRSRDAMKRGIGGALARLVGQVIGPITMLMTRKMLLTIKARAEQFQILVPSAGEKSAV